MMEPSLCRYLLCALSASSPTGRRWRAEDREAQVQTLIGKIIGADDPLARDLPTYGAGGDGGAAQKPPGEHTMVSSKRGSDRNSPPPPRGCSS